MATETKPKILLVEDASAIHMVVESLVSSFCEVQWVDNLTHAEKALGTQPFELLLLDVVLPDGSGFDFCEKIRARPNYQNLQIMFLTSRDDVSDRVKGFSLGADDYVTKPLEPNEFIARVKAKIERAAKNKLSHSFVRDKFKLNLVSQKAFLLEQGSEVDLNLTPIEFKLFSLLLKNEGQVYNRADLKKFVWGQEVHLADHTVDTHVSSLRKKLSPYSGYLKSVIKTGYVFTTAPVERSN